ncbi:GDSL-type esterase/lipase family protein [Microbulbifer magnicolonia]|uniref:GDSL-type esterase/lipase family protein n=1 Tax=Microbulbifer magnicolonia TaxID=3109744 RepID=UPI002B416246|nr:GDSL-type esterase/lipase family protein [Microbulbifer sp. GG15]
MRRHIRLKEWGPSIDKSKAPTAEYVKSVDGSISQKEFRVRTDRNGFITSGRDLESREFSAQFFFLGDSFVESVFVDEELRFPAYFEEICLRNKLPLVAYNGGYSGATTLHLLNTLLNKIGFKGGAGNMKAKVLFVLPSNDALCLTKAGGYWAFHNKRYSPVVPQDEACGYTVDSVEYSEELLLPLLVSACCQLNLELFLATFPHRGDIYGGDEWLSVRYPNERYYNTVLSWRNRANLKMREFAKSSNLHFVDFDERLSGKSELFYDDLHLNELGSKVAAEYLWDEIQGAL